MTGTPKPTPTAPALTRSTATWVVRTGDAVIGESKDVITVAEGEGTPAVYFPRNDIAMALLDQSDHQTQHDAFGKATFFSVVSPAATLPNSAWSFESPPEDMAELKDRIAFWGDDLAIEAL